MRERNPNPMFAEESEENDVESFSSEHFTEGQLTELSPLNWQFYVRERKDKNATGRPSVVHGPIDLFSVVGQSDEIRKRLIDLFTQFVSVLTEADDTARVSHDSLYGPTKTKDKEMKWLENNKEQLAQLVNNWIVIEGDELIVSSQDFSETLKVSKARGIKVPFIVYVPERARDATLGI